LQARHGAASGWPASIRVSSKRTISNLQQVELIFHGGEPLLAGKHFFRQFTEEAHCILLPDVTPIFNMQTNGTLLDAEWLDLLIDLKIGFGISLDGPKEINDRHRVDHRGAGSYDAVRKAVDLVLRNLALLPYLAGY
jgi:uncharacterized protein